jgi:putative ABC transport system permease protein
VNPELVQATVFTSPTLQRSLRRDSPYAAAVLSHGLWLRRFGGDPHVVGQTVRLDGRPTLVVGVMPKSFDFPTGAELWLPLTLHPNQWNDRHNGRLSVVAMLKPGVSISEAQTELSGIAARIEQTFPGRDKLNGALVEDIRNVINGNLMPMFISVMIRYSRTIPRKHDS